MENLFESRFGINAKWRVECPGRVNLIGEHIDYHGYSVLPMAINEKTTVLIAPLSTQEIRFENVSDSFGPRTEALPSQWESASKPSWSDYLLAGWKEVTTVFGLPQTGFAVLMDSTVPAAAGLSSSSSLVCAAALATLTVSTDGDPWKLIDKRRLAEVCMKAEHRIGTAGGGMDQAAECLAEAGSALHVSFNPLSSERVSLPANSLFVVADSKERKNKAASNEYNTRVVEGRIATALLGKRLGVQSWKEARRLSDVETATGLTLAQLVQEAGKLPAEMTESEARVELGDHLDALLTPDTRQIVRFFIRSRALHVYSEAERVLLFKEACEQGDIKRMGELMNESHESCSKLYECSTPAVDQVVEALRQEGALGARLTGAGWGGCAVALFDIDSFGSGDTVLPEHCNILFKSTPAQGINVITL